MKMASARRLLPAMAASIAATVFVPAWAQPAAAPQAAGAERDGAGQTLQDLYQAALKEGGTLTVYAGGDEVSQGFGIKAGFERQFPGMKLNIVVDLSKYHDARIEEELLRKDLQVDVAQLQTLHDFDDWAARGLLLPYKPIGWDSYNRRDLQGREAPGRSEALCQLDAVAAGGIEPASVPDPQRRRPAGGFSTDRQVQHQPRGLPRVHA
jgi:hypothetical protein